MEHCSMNVNRFEQSVCELRSVSLRGERSGDAHNIKIKINIFKEGFVRLTNSCAFYKHLWLMKVCASNPSLKKTSLIPSSWCVLNQLFAKEMNAVQKMEDFER